MSRLRFGLVAVACAGFAAFVGAQDKQSFAPKFKDDKGALTPYYQKSSTNVIQVIKVQNQELTQKQESTFYYKWEPLRQEGDKWIVKQTVEGLRMSIDISGNAIVYDSANKDASGSASNPGLINFFKNLEGSSFEVTLGKDFKVESVNQRDRDAFLNKLSANNPQMDALLKKILTDEALKQMVDPTMGLTPDAPQAVGGTWTKKVPLNLGPIGVYEVTYNFKYDRQEGEIAHVSVTTGLTYTAPKDATDGLLFRIKSGTLKSVAPAAPAGQPVPPNGTMQYNTRTGRIQSARITLKVEGELTVTIGGTDTNVKLDQEQTTTIETRDTSYMTPTTPAGPIAPVAPPKP